MNPNASYPKPSKQSAMPCAVTPPPSCPILDDEPPLDLLDRIQIVLAFELEVHFGLLSLFHVSLVFHAMHLGFVERRCVGIQSENDLSCFPWFEAFGLACRRDRN